MPNADLNEDVELADNCLFSHPHPGRPQSEGFHSSGTLPLTEENTQREPMQEQEFRRCSQADLVINDGQGQLLPPFGRGRPYPMAMPARDEYLVDFELKDKNFPHYWSLPT